MSKKIKEEEPRGIDSERRSWKWLKINCGQTNLLKPGSHLIV